MHGMKIVLEKVSKSFGPATVLENIDLEITSGKVIGLQGINGSGKTMLMRMIAGLIYPTSGSVSIDGRPLRGENSFPGSMGLLIEEPVFLNNYTGLANLKLLASIQGSIHDEDIAAALTRVGLDPSDKRKYKKYSLGMRQRLGIACAIMESPELIILDEPLNSLDEEGIGLVRKIVGEEKEKGRCIVLSCHDYEELTFMSDEIYKIVAGKIVRKMTKESTGTWTEESL